MAVLESIHTNHGPLHMAMRYAVFYEHRRIVKWLHEIGQELEQMPKGTSDDMKEYCRELELLT